MVPRGTAFSKPRFAKIEEHIAEERQEEKEQVGERKRRRKRLQGEGGKGERGKLSPVIVPLTAILSSREDFYVYLFYTRPPVSVPATFRLLSSLGSI